MQLYIFAMFVHLHFRSWIETLDAWTLRYLCSYTSMLGR
jgi:hypothetical protein